MDFFNNFANNNVYIKTIYNPTTYLRANTFFSFFNNFLDSEFVDLNTAANLWEEFHLIQVGINPNVNGYKYVIRSYNNKFISANTDGNVKLSNNQLEWEIFEIIEQIVGGNTYYLIKSIHHNRYLKVYYQDSRIELMDLNNNIDISNYFIFEISNPIIQNILLQQNTINNIVKNINRYKIIQDRGRPLSRIIKKLIIEVMEKIVEINNPQQFGHLQRNIIPDLLEELTYIYIRINMILDYDNYKELRDIYSEILIINIVDIGLLTDNELYNIFEKTIKNSNKYIECLNLLFEKYEQDFEEPLLYKKWIEITTIIVALLSLIIAIISLCIQFRQ
jgi:hypothetical protein